MSDHGAPSTDDTPTPSDVGADSSPAGASGGRTLAQVVVDAGLLSREQAIQAEATAKRERLPLGRVLVRDGLVLSRDLAALSALSFGLAMVDLSSQSIDADAVATLPKEVARKYLVLPIAKDGNLLTVAMTEPMDLRVVQDLAARTGCSINAVVATLEDLQEHIEISYRVIEASGAGSPHVADAIRGQVAAGVLRDAAPAQLIDLLLRQALQDRASDIHIEQADFRLRVRFRIDGILHDVVSLPPEMHPAVISRLKIASGMNIAERRRPQDGQFAVEFQDREVDVRVAVSDTVDGEMAVLRLLDKRFNALGLDQLGMSPQVWGVYRRLLRLPYGMVVVCGPTGAGKSTTLYASILQMNRMEKNVISLEDPVEYRIADANQMQMHREAGVTFATQLRGILRLDPDVIMVGEIRDQETATIATQAALTGHLVITSLHANDSVSALLRLKDLGVAPYLIASSVAGVVSQRMVRVVCSGCKTVMPRPAAERDAYASEMGEKRDVFVHGTGCNLCAHTGYRGRTGIFEILKVTDTLRQTFLEETARGPLWEQAIREGMIPLRREGMGKVKQGATTPYEVMRILFSLD